MWHFAKEVAVNIEINNFRGKPEEALPLVNHLLPHLDPSGQGPGVSLQDLEEAFSNPNFYLCFAENDEDTKTPKRMPERCLGMGTVFIQKNLSGRIAEIHDIVTHPDARGKGAGKRIVLELVDIVRYRAKAINQSIEIRLTSRPSRIEANKLYQKLGFELAARAEGPHGTNLYKLIVAP
jgi:ribosomal protein S18 acetylase RimI-like enzyme